MLAGDLVHVLLVPEPGISDRNSRLVADACLLELAQDGRDHRSQVRKVAGLGGDLRGKRDALLVDGGLRVVALNVVAERLHQPRVRIGQVDLALRDIWRPVGIRLRAEPAAVTRPARRAIVLVGIVAATLRCELVLQQRSGARIALTKMWEEASARSAGMTRVRRQF